MRNDSFFTVRRKRGSGQRGGSPGGPRRRLGLLAVFALIAALLGAAPAASSQELLSGVADESGTAGPRWTRTFFTPETTRDHTLTLAWTGGGNLSMAVRIAATNQWVDDANTSNNPEVLTTELTAGVEYKIAVWAVSGVGTYTLTVDDEPTSGLELLSGVADESGTAGPRWTRTFFTPETTRDHTLTLAWTGGGNLSMAVRVAATNQFVDDATTANNPEVLTTELTAGVEYKIAVWAVSGVGTFTLTVDDDQEPPSNGLTIQRNHLDAAAGPSEIRADFTPTTSGPVTVELSWSGSADLDLVVQREDNGAVIGESTGSGNPERVVADVIPGVDYEIRSIAVSGSADYAVSLAGERDRPTPPAGAPNILIINVDDARTDALEVMDAVMQWFGDDGTFFPNGYITTPACCPSRAALMSGQYNHNNGQIEQNVEHLDEADTLQHYLYDAGYLTGHTGKFLHYVDTSRRGLYWDRWNYFKGGYFDVWMNRDGYGHQSVGYSTVITFDRAVEFAEDFDSFEDDRPWLLHVTPIAPHRPSLPEEKYEDAPVPAWSPDPSVGEADRSDKPPFVRNFNYSPAEGEAERAEMLRTLMSVDEQVDRLMTRLDALGELGNTLAIFTSDNGVLWGEHGLPEKFVPYQRAIDVPFLIRWPGHVPAGAVDDRPVANIDIAPTVLAAAGVASGHLMDGSDILSGFVRPWRFTEYFLDEANGLGLPSWSSIRSDTIEYTEYSNEAGAITFREYYDLVTDPYELVNLLADGDPGNDPDVTGLHDLVEQYSACAAETCRSVHGFVDEAVSAGIYEVNESWEAVPVDYDLDGDLDLWIGLHDQGARLWSNDGDGTFTRAAPTAWPKVNQHGRIPDRHTCTFADVDGDGDVDAYCTAGRGGDNPVKYDRENELWLQTSPGTFAEVGRQWGVGELCGRSHYAAFLHANGDSYPDLYVGNTPPRDDPTDPCDDPANELPSEEAKLFINSGGTALVATTTMGIGGFGGGRCAEVVDFNGDGWDDLLVCGNPATYLFANQGGTGFIDVAPAQQLSATVSDAVMGDLDGDGDGDLVTINWTNVSYRLNDNGVFGAVVSIAVLNPPGGRSVDVGDADGDGDLDVYVLRANGIQGTNPDDILFLNDSLSFTPVPVPAASGVGDAVTALDIDGDGATEFVVLNGLTFGPIQLLRLTTE